MLDPELIRLAGDYMFGMAWIVTLLFLAAMFAPSDRDDPDRPSLFNLFVGPPWMLFYLFLAIYTALGAVEIAMEMLR